MIAFSEFIFSFEILSMTSSFYKRNLWTPYTDVEDVGIGRSELRAYFPFLLLEMSVGESQDGGGWAWTWVVGPAPLFPDGALNPCQLVHRNRSPAGVRLSVGSHCHPSFFKHAWALRQELLRGLLSP